MPREHDTYSRIAELNAKFDAVTLSITGIALTLRLIVVLLVVHAKSSAWFYSQASELGEVAHSLAVGLGFASPFGGNTGPSAFLPPGYPLLVSTLFRLFGSYSRGAEVVLLLAQAFFGAAAVLMLMLVAKRLFGRTTAHIAGLILALDPWLIALGFVFWDTSLSLALIPAVLLLCLRWRDHPSSSLAITTAVLGAFAITVNASLALIVVGWSAWAVWSRRDQARNILPAALLFPALCGLWPLRNAMTMHAFIPLRDNLGYELWQGNRVGGDGFFAPELHPNTNKDEFRQFEDMGELGYMHHKARLAKETIVANPRRFLRLTGKRVFCFWLGISRHIYGNQIGIAALTTLLAIAGLLLYLRDRGGRMALPLMIPLLLFPLPYYVTHPDFRFWCLLSPLLTSLAIYTFTRRIESDPQSRRTTVQQAIPQQ